MNDKTINKINRMLKRDYKYIEEDMPYNDEILKLATIIANNPMVMPLNLELGNRSPQIAIDEAAEFFGSFSPELQYRFYNILNGDTIKFKKDNELQEEAYINDDGSSMISYRGSLNDSYTIIHEFFHKFSLVYDESDATISSILIECSSVLSELLFKDFIKKKNCYSTEEINEALYDRFCNVYCVARYFIFEMALFSYYKQYQSITNYNHFKKYCVSIGLEPYEVDAAIKELANKDDFAYFKVSTYILAVLFGCYYHQKYSNNEQMQYNVLEEITDIISLDDLKFNESIKRLKALKVPFITDDVVEVSATARSALSIAYVKELCTLMKEQELENSQVKR